MSKQIKAGEAWEVDGRKGPLIIRPLVDVNEDVDAFFEAEIVEGKARFMSRSYNEAQREDGLGTTGTIMSFRTGLCRFISRVE